MSKISLASDSPIKPRELAKLASAPVKQVNELLGEMQEFKDKPGETKLYIELSGRDPDDGMTSVAYQKGSLFLEMLERAVGREKFDPFLKAWFDEHAFGSVTTPELERFLRVQLFAGRGALFGRRRGRLRDLLHLRDCLRHLIDALGLLQARLAHFFDHRVAVDRRFRVDP